MSLARVIRTAVLTAFIPAAAFAQREPGFARLPEEK